MEEKRPARGLSGESPEIAQGHDYEYDEAHDLPAGRLAEPRAPRPVNPPQERNFGEGGDYGYDEAHDFRTS